MGLSRQEYWSELPVLSPGYLPDLAIKPTSPALAGRYSTKVCSQVILIHINVSAAAKSLQSCLTLCDPIDFSPSGSPVPGILQYSCLENSMDGEAW